MDDSTTNHHRVKAGHHGTCSVPHLTRNIKQGITYIFNKNKFSAVLIRRRKSSFEKKIKKYIKINIVLMEFEIHNIRKN